MSQITCNLFLFLWGVFISIVCLVPKQGFYLLQCCMFVLVRFIFTRQHFQAYQRDNRLQVFSCESHESTPCLLTMVAMFTYIPKLFKLRKKIPQVLKQTLKMSQELKCPKAYPCCLKLIVKLSRWCTLSFLAGPCSFWSGGSVWGQFP